jgi:uncharacterized protein YukE
LTIEELKLKVSIDTSGLQQDVAKVKTSLKGAEDSLSGKGIQKGAKVTSASLGQVRDELDKIRNLQVFDILSDQLTKLKPHLEEIGKIDFSNLTSSMKMLKEDIAGLFTTAYFTETEDMEEALGSFEIQFKEIGKSFKHVGKAVKNIGKDAGKVMKALGSAIKEVLGSAVIGLAAVVAEVVAIVAATKMAIQNAKAIAQLSRDAAKVGMSTHAYEEWGYILTQNGIQIDKLSDFLKTLAAEQNAVREGTEDTIKAFERLGLSASEVSNMSQTELFEKTVEGLQKIESQVERTGLAYKIFGEDDAANIIPLLSLSNEQLRQMRENYEALGGAASQTLVNRSQELQGSLTNLSTAWQGVKNAITEGFLPIIIKVVNWLTIATAKIGIFFRALFGTDATKAENSTNSMSSGMSSYTTAVDGATKAVQKLKREQMGFDELNVLPGKDSPSGGGSGASGGGVNYGGTGDMNIPGFDALENIQEKLQGFKDWVEKYKSEIQMLVPLLTTVAGIALAVLGFCLGNIPLGIAGIGLAGIGIAIGVANGGWAQIGAAIKTALQTIVLVIATFAKSVGNKIQELGQTIGKWGKKVFNSISQWFKDVGKAIADWYKETDAKLDAFWKKIGEWFKKNVAPIFTKKYWQEKFATISASASEKLGAAKTAINTKWKEVKDWFNKNVKDKFTKKYWQTKFDGVRAGIADKISAAKKSCTDAWSSIKTWFNKSVSPKFTKNYWQTKFDTIKSGAKASFNGIIGIVESAINKIINKINTLSWKIPDWVPSVGGSKFGFNFKTISIPRLATGGIATRSTLANIGEAGAEAVLPLENNTGWMDKLADKIASRSGGPGKLVLNVDGKTLGWVAIDNINQITKQTGEIPLAI